MLWSRLFPSRRSDDNHAAALIYRAVVAQARRPAFYAAYGVPDTLDGRFDMIALHMFAVLYRLKADTDAAGLSQGLFDTMFGDMDRSLREMGGGDLGVGRRVRAMAEGLYGRMAAYEAGLGADDATLSAALRRNLYGSLGADAPAPEAVAALCAYVRSSVRNLAGRTVEQLRTGNVTFPDVPAV